MPVHLRDAATAWLGLEEVSDSAMLPLSPLSLLNQVMGGVLAHHPVRADNAASDAGLDDISKTMQESLSAAFDCNC